MSGVAGIDEFHIGHCYVLLSVTVENSNAIESSVQSKSFRRTYLLVFYIRINVVVVVVDDGDDIELIEQENLIFLNYF
ncbi:unnamed protein product [Rotaria sp. Silwood2]|nr:unnamed protein product [Rotaria sp. Silwood2]CAF2958701.1 unnamed protein product [Rotaria sp. Silwood2]CAF4178620.1 unnamed protein product [Rotaria sp. Silwood2]CAF4324259.1 unnamed protein product [Rotaria sp. Silwood2]